MGVQRNRGQLSHYNWHQPHEGLGGLCPVDRVCERAGKTPIWADVAAAYGAMKERAQMHDQAVKMSLQKLK